ncbi:MAG TPA: DNA alkylation repair protein [Acidimicrobiales bacterium]|nr:DNA alkylation repair protein [Acidimicrobiales bacterium]
MDTVVDPAAVADEVDRRIRGLDAPSVDTVRRVRRDVSAQLEGESGADVVAVALALIGRQRWVAYEIVYHHPAALDALTVADVERLGTGLADWGSVDAFGRYLSGPAWRRGSIPDATVRGWAASPDRWWRRAALVSTVPLNLAAAGGTGDTDRTLDICERLVADRDDMVVKALSWALRELVPRDPDAVRGFLRDHDDAVAARVRREVTAKLETGRKNPGPARRDGGGHQGDRRSASQASDSG